VSLEKIAKVLCVDEVELLHGPKGVAVRVRIEKSWHVSTIDNEDLEGRRLEAIAEHLQHLADANVHKARGGLRKSVSNAVFDMATQAALRADADAARSRSEALSQWVPDTVKESFAGIDRQVFRPFSMSYSQPTPQPAPAEPAVSKPMQSRFHAIIDELRNL
jgi:glycyl-tRNA synthetase (class II)